MTPKQIQKLFAFDGNRDKPASEASAQAILQSEGVASLWYLFKEKGFAYLADEVGMGKTRQAMAVIAMQFLKKPDSRVVIVCPGETLQQQWLTEWDLFVRNCVRPIAYHLRTEHCLVEAPVRPLLHHRLHDFVQALLLDEAPLHLLRYSSFSRPIGFRGANSRNDIKEQYCHCLRQVGIDNAWQQEEENIVTENKMQGRDEAVWRPELTRNLNSAYVHRIRPLIGNRPIDLIVFDEAQYLRRTDNRQNTHIRQLFTNQNISKWLFLSATPLHTSEKDLFSLDDYLCTHSAAGKDASFPCQKAECENPGCAQLRHQHDNEGTDIIDLMKTFVVRRTRKYVDARNNHYSKTKYRDYRKSPAYISTDPFYALTSALVQKHLVAALDGNNNRFRQGECSSFESLASSVGGLVQDSDGNSQRQELENTNSNHQAQEQTTLDRSLIDQLNESFRKAFGPLLGRESDETLAMPHAKLMELVDQLDKRCLRNGVNHKTLVFVRRLDTVDELLVQLNARLQKEVDRRVELWASWLEAHTDWCKQPLNPETFWQSYADEDLESDDNEKEKEAILSIDLGKAEELPYFKARRSKGFIWSFSQRLQKEDRSPLNWLRSRENSQNTYWDKLLSVLYPDQASMPQWLTEDHAHPNDQYWNLVTLKQCILQTLRHSDFLVDLYILDKHVVLPSLGRKTNLGDKLLALLEDNGLPSSGDLRQLGNNWRIRLRNWCDHFALIRDKSLRSRQDETPEELSNNMWRRFVGASPILARSGRIQNGNVVPQFKIPGAPNILISTDVLKEGVDLHLFCDEVIHYGVAWTSGDLEQRIGRIDRVGSLYQRKISSFDPKRNEADYPRMKIEFPYLQGTLDEMQVTRVVYDKGINDQRMDLGRRKEQLEHDVNKLSLGSVNDDPGLLARQPVFFSLSEHNMVMDEEIEQRIRQRPQDIALHRRIERFCEALEEKNGLLHYLPDLGLLRMEYLVSTEASDIGTPDALPAYPGLRHGRWNKQKKDWKLHRTTLISKNIDIHALQALMKTLEQDQGKQGAFGVLHASGFGDNWQFHPDWKTLYQEIEVDAPFNQTDKRRQEVIIETTGSCWLLRSPISVVTEDNTEGAVDWLVQQNDHRTLGQVVLDRNILWLEQSLYQPELALLSPDDINRLAHQIARTADRLQQLYLEGADPSEWNYQARSALSSALISNLPPLMNQDGNTLTMQHDLELQRSYGKSLSQIHRWIREAYQETLRALATQQDDSAESIEKTLIDNIECQIDSDGVIKLTMPNGKVRFRLSVFLDLVPATSESVHANVYHGPRVIWELCVPTSTRGPVPGLQDSNYEDLPHLNPNEWDNIAIESATHSVHTSLTDNRRYLVLYHRADLLDRYRDALTECWGRALSSMQTERFMRKPISEWFTQVFTPE